MTKYIILPTLAEEALEPWVWSASRLNAIKGFIKIENPLNRNKIIVFNRTIDENFIDIYNNKPRTKTIKLEKNYLVINEYYRNKLKININTEIDLVIKDANCWDKIFIMHKDHPHPIVQYSNRITFIAFLLGIIGIVLAIISLIK